MLSDKKSMIGQSEIDFLGMHVSNGQYHPGPHLAQQLLDFPDSHLSQKQIQQFLSIINFIQNFIPKVSHYTSRLSALLKKNLPLGSHPHISRDSSQAGRPISSCSYYSFHWPLHPPDRRQ
ncbi:hypothetical protein Dsin_005361 [Dipteronia sinensis]|uniref:Uncharacterized protein n=1 Tax=Dipteronia sinensis TaxID=43782 RepID=A0AAE0AXR2_9ROSI|nr:hypothetical protein Dsin_005361 [Dipteronia sinensis]